MGRVCRARRNERRHRTRLGDALFENLSVLRFVIKRQRRAVHRLVKLPFRRIDSDFPKQCIQAKRARFVGNDGYQIPADPFVLQQQAEQTAKGHGRRDFPGRTPEEFGKMTQRRHVQLHRLDVARRHEPAQGLAAFEQILDLRTVGGRTIERRSRDYVIADRDVEAFAKFAKLLLVHLFLLVRNVAALARFAQAVTLHGFGQDHRGLALMFRRRLVGGIDFSRVVTAAHQLANLLIGEVMYELEQFGIFAEEMFPRVAARFDDIFLIIAVHRLFHALEQQPGLVAREQIIPVGTPDHLDDVPARAPEQRFQFLDNFPVAAHRTVQTLEVAIDDPDEVVEIFARRQRERTQRFRLVAFAVANETPDLRILIADELAGLQVAIKPRLVDGHDRTKAHRNRRELPEIRHQIRMRIRREAAAFGEFLAEILQVRLRQPTFEKRPRVNAGRSVALKINRVAREIFGPPPEEMIKRHLVKRRRRSVRRNVPAHVRGMVRLHDHRHRVPAHQAFQADFGLPVAGILRLLRDRDGIRVRGIEAARQFVLVGAQTVSELFQQLRRALRPLAGDGQVKDRLDGVGELVALGSIRTTVGEGRRARTVNFFFLSFHCVTHFKGNRREMERQVAPGKSGRLNPKWTPNASEISTERRA